MLTSIGVIKLSWMADNVIDRELTSKARMADEVGIDHLVVLTQRVWTPDVLADAVAPIAEIPIA
jgi:hypothetical protein